MFLTSLLLCIYELQICNILAVSSKFTHQSITDMGSLWMMATISKGFVNDIMMTRTPLLYVAQWHWSLAIQMLTHSSLDVTDLEMPTNSLLMQMPGVSHIKQSPIENSSIIVIKDR